MTKNKKIALVLMLAIVASAITCACLYAYLSTQKVTIYIFNDSFSEGALLQENMLSKIEVDKKVVEENRKASVTNQFVTETTLKTFLSEGNRLLVGVDKGVPLMKGMLSRYTETTLEKHLSSDKIGITIKVDNVTGITGELRRNAHVNVFYTDRAGETICVFENIRIVDVQKKDKQLSAATLEVTKAEATKLVKYANTGYLYLGIIDENGYSSYESEE